MMDMWELFEKLLYTVVGFGLGWIANDFVEAIETWSSRNRKKS